MHTIYIYFSQHVTPDGSNWIVDGCYMLNSTGMTWSAWTNVCISNDALLVAMETQAEYATLKQYITANAGCWSDSV